jgi:deoxyribose-phosphate aldolase
MESSFNTSVERTMLESRASEFTKRSIKKDSKVFALKLAVSMVDLTTLEGADTEGCVVNMCQKARNPHPGIPSVAAVCVYPNLVPIAKRELEGSGVKVASVSTSFPSGQVPLEVKLHDTEIALKYGADEIDMVVARGHMLEGKMDVVAKEIQEIKSLCGDTHLKVILETGELGSYERVREASFVAMVAGADFIKTSTGKIASAANMPVTLLMLEAIRDYYDRTGKKIGMKPAGGIRTAKQAIHYLVMVNETLGPDWLTPDLFRFGASTLLNDLLMQLEKQRLGNYQGAHYFSLPT